MGSVGGRLSAQHLACLYLMWARGRRGKKMKILLGYLFLFFHVSLVSHGSHWMTTTANIIILYEAETIAFAMSHGMDYFNVSQWNLQGVHYTGSWEDTMRKYLIFIYLRTKSSLQTHGLKELTFLDKEISQSFTLPMTGRPHKVNNFHKLSSPNIL